MGLRNMCECSATANIIGVDNNSVRLVICPECTLEENVFLYSAELFTFTATDFGKPQCIFYDNNISALSIAGKGTIVLSNTTEFEATFTVSLIENDFVDLLFLTLAGVDNEGVPFSLQRGLPASDGNLTITSCGG